MKHIDHKEDDNIDNRRKWNRNGRVRVQLKQSFRLSIYILKHINIMMLIMILTTAFMMAMMRRDPFTYLDLIKNKLLGKSGPVQG